MADCQLSVLSQSLSVLSQSLSVLSQSHAMTQQGQVLSAVDRWHIPGKCFCGQFTCVTFIYTDSDTHAKNTFKKTTDPSWTLPLFHRVTDQAPLWNINTSRSQHWQWTRHSSASVWHSPTRSWALSWISIAFCLLVLLGVAGTPNWSCVVFGTRMEACQTNAQRPQGSREWKKSWRPHPHPYQK